MRFRLPLFVADDILASRASGFGSKDPPKPLSLLTVLFAISGKIIPTGGGVPGLDLSLSRHLYVESIALEGRVWDARGSC
jgi:hypothetical protein